MHKIKTTKFFYIFALLFLFLNFFSNVALSTDVRLYAFGHSLIDHRPPLIATPSDETTILHWINEMALAANHTFATGGQYGFLTSHDDLPPTSQWGYDNIPAVWDDTVQTFSQANINAILITAANFIQDVPPNQAHPLDGSTTVVASTEVIFDWVNSQQSNVKYYIYENWPEMDLQNAYPPTPPLQTEVDDFHQQTLNGFDDWWINYDNLIQASRPLYDIELIPVGPVISQILTQVIPGQVPFTELYEDSAPHGRATLYFLAAMVTYTYIYDENIPSSYMPDSIVHIGVRNNLAQIRNFIHSQKTNLFSNGFE